MFPEHEMDMRRDQTSETCLGCILPAPLRNDNGDATANVRSWWRVWGEIQYQVHYAGFPYFITARYSHAWPGQALWWHLRGLIIFQQDLNAGDELWFDSGARESRPSSPCWTIHHIEAINYFYVCVCVCVFVCVWWERERERERERVRDRQRDRAHQ